MKGLISISCLHVWYRVGARRPLTGNQGKQLAWLSSKVQLPGLKFTNYDVLSHFLNPSTKRNVKTTICNNLQSESHVTDGGNQARQLVMCLHAYCWLTTTGCVSLARVFC